MIKKMKAIKIPCEHDLLNKDHDVWANAVMRCKTHNPYCGADGYCHADGKCFTNQELTREQAILEVDRLSQELYILKNENDRLKQLPKTLIQQLELALDQNIKKRENSQRAFALKYCISEIKRVLGV